MLLLILLSRKWKVKLRSILPTAKPLILDLYVPKKIEALIRGGNNFNTPTNLFFAAAVLVIPATKGFLSTILKASFTRWLNTCVGLVLTVIMVLIAFTPFTSCELFTYFLQL